MAQKEERKPIYPQPKLPPLEFPPMRSSPDRPIQTFPSQKPPVDVGTPSNPRRPARTAPAPAPTPTPESQTEVYEVQDPTTGQWFAVPKDITQQEFDYIFQDRVQPTPEEPPSALSKAYEWANTVPQVTRDIQAATTDKLEQSGINRAAMAPEEELRKYIVNPQRDPRGTRAYREYLHPTPIDELRRELGQEAGFIGGAGEGIAQMTTPQNAALLGLGAGEGAAINRALQATTSLNRARQLGTAAKWLGRGRIATSVPLAAQSAGTMLNPEATPMERAMAIFGLAGGVVGSVVPTARMKPARLGPPPAGTSPEVSQAIMQATTPRTFLERTTGINMPSIEAVRRPGMQPIPSHVPQGQLDLPLSTSVDWTQRAQTPRTPEQPSLFNIGPESVPQVNYPPEPGRVRGQRPSWNPPQDRGQGIPITGPNVLQPGETPPIPSRIPPEVDPSLIEFQRRLEGLPPDEPPPDIEPRGDLQGPNIPIQSPEPVRTIPQETSGLSQSAESLMRQIDDLEQGLVDARAAKDREAAYAINQVLNSLRKRLPPEGGPISGMSDDLFKGSEGRGLGKESFEEQWQQATKEAELLGIDWHQYDNLDQLQWDITRAAARETIRTGVNPLSKPISRAIYRDPVTGEESLKMDIGDPTDMIKIFRNTYAGGVPYTATKELLQNAIDAVARQPGGKINTYVDEMNREITVTDNGPGLTRDQVGSIFTNLSSSGKRGGAEKTIGELGVGKTTYLVSGEYVKVHTTADYPDGVRRVTQFEGTPEDIMTKAKNFITFKAPPGQPTGTEVTIKVQPTEDMKLAKKFLDNFNKYSASPVPIDVTHIREHSYRKGERVETSSPIAPRQAVTGGKPVVDVETPSSKYKISIPSDAQWGDRSDTMLILQNRGMLQGIDSTWLTYGPPLELPDRLLVELDPKVPGDDPNYPLTAPTRERLKDPEKQAISRDIRTALVIDKERARGNEMQRVWDSIVPTPGNKHVLHDVGGLYTPEEFNRLNNSRVAKESYLVMNDIKDDLLSLFPEVGQSNKTIDQLGYVTSDKLRGVNFQRLGDNNKHIIMVNLPKIIARNGMNDDRIANELVHVVMHEFTHMLEREEGAGFTAKLADVYGRYDVERQLNAKRQFLSIIDRGRNREIPNILQDYSASRGRTNTASDILTRSRQSDFLTGEGPGGTIEGGRDYGAGTPPPPISPMSEPQIPGRPYRTGTLREVNPELEEGGFWQKLYNAPRGLMSVDLPFLTSAGFRQGLGQIFSRHWFEAWVKSFEAYASKPGFRAQMESLETSDPLFVRRRNYSGPRDTIGRPAKSIAEEAGLDLTLREEGRTSTWIERIPGYGKHIEASNRAYSAFLQHLRTGTFKQLAMDLGAWDGQNVLNAPLLKELAEYVNVTTGRGKLELSAGWKPSQRATNTLSLERQAKFLTGIAFSPRLMASRIKMLNPSTYLMASPAIRQQYLKSLIRSIGAWWGIASLAEMAGADVNRDPNSTDYGKIRIGNTRIDPGGGLQQYLVLAHRLWPMNIPASEAMFGETLPASTAAFGMEPTDTGVAGIDLATSYFGTSGGGTSGTEMGAPFVPYGQGYKPDTAGSTLARFLRGKMHPTLTLAADILTRSERYPVYVFDRAAQMALPLMASDLAEVAVNDPELMPLIAGVSTIGMGAQTFEPGPGTPSFTPAIDEYLGTDLQNLDIKLN